MNGMVYLSNERISNEGLNRYALKELLKLSHEDYSGNTLQINMCISSEDGLYVPRAFMNGRFYEPSIDGSEGLALSKTSINPKFSLRDYQQDAVEAIYRATTMKGGSILVGGCGTGKTVMGCYLIKQLGRRALVLVHKEFLMQQFKDTLNLIFPDLVVGLWRRDQEPNGSEDVVITMVQSIMGRDYDASCYEGFGTIITDEVHRFSAPLWSNAIGRFDARYRVGLTATPDRSDGLERVFMSHIGSIEHEVRGNLLSADIYPIEFNYTYPMKDYILWDGQVSISKLITVLAKDDMRSEVIIDYAVRSLMTGRKVLILCDRRQHVTYLAFKCSERLESLRALREDMPKDLQVAAYLGGMKASDREDAERADLIIGTYSMAQEGLDIPRLDTLFLASPKTNVTQAIGRILRPHSDKKKPVVLDFIDNVGMLKGFARKRKKQYAQNGYTLKRALSDVASP